VKLSNCFIILFKKKKKKGFIILNGKSGNALRLCLVVELALLLFITIFQKNQH
jgi:hypothetical protein